MQKIVFFLFVFFVLLFWMSIAVLNYEEDIATYTIKAVTDLRADNHVLTCKSQGNIISQLDLISCWEKKTGRILRRIQ